MDIKRVDDKKIDIHKKKKAKVHVKKKTKPSDKKMTIHTKNAVATGAGAAKRKMISHVDGGEEIDGVLVKSGRRYRRKHVLL